VVGANRERADLFTAELKRMRDVYALAVDPGFGHHPNYDPLKRLCAMWAHGLMRDLSRKKITGTKDDAFRAIASLLYEAISGQHDVDLKRGCDYMLRFFPATISKLRFRARRLLKRSADSTARMVPNASRARLLSRATSFMAATVSSSSSPGSKYPCTRRVQILASRCIRSRHVEAIKTMVSNIEGSLKHEELSIDGILPMFAKISFFIRLFLVEQLQALDFVGIRLAGETAITTKAETIDTFETVAHLFDVVADGIEIEIENKTPIATIFSSLRRRGSRGMWLPEVENMLRQMTKLFEKDTFSVEWSAAPKDQQQPAPAPEPEPALVPEPAPTPEPALAPDSLVGLYPELAPAPETVEDRLANVSAPVPASELAPTPDTPETIAMQQAPASVSAPMSVVLILAIILATVFFVGGGLVWQAILKPPVPAPVYVPAPAPAPVYVPAPAPVPVMPAPAPVPVMPAPAIKSYKLICVPPRDPRESDPIARIHVEVTLVPPDMKAIVHESYSGRTYNRAAQYTNITVAGAGDSRVIWRGTLISNPLLSIVSVVYLNQNDQFFYVETHYRGASMTGTMTAPCEVRSAQ
jgi:hypothetical protein